MTIGYYDKEKFKGDMHWNDVTYKYMYGVKMDDIKFKDQPSNVCSKSKNGECLITFDSGTSLMSIPSFAHEHFKELGIPTANLAKKCNSEEEFGDMSLVIGGKDYV